MRVIFAIALVFAFSTVSFGQDTLRAIIHFEFNKSELSPTDIATLDSLKEILKDQDIDEIRIDGHTDNIGSETFNLNLSASRSSACLSYLNSIMAHKISTTPLYYKTPVASNKSEEGRRQNRRAEIIVILSKEPIPTIVIKPLIEDVPEQSYTISTKDTTFIEAKEGTRLIIPPGSLLFKNGNVAQGPITIHIKEYLNTADILLAGLNTVSDSSILETGGMVNIVILSGKDTLTINGKVPITLRLPAGANPNNNMQVFGTHSANDTSWIPSTTFFEVTKAHWEWPKFNNWKDNELNFDHLRYEEWAVGRGFTDEYFLRHNWGISFEKEASYKDVKAPRLRKATYTLLKTDTNTLKITFHASLRRRGKRFFQKKYYDTTFFVKYRKEEYSAPINRINWINCDRFMNNKGPKVDFYAKTEEIQGGAVALYFTSLKAFLPGTPVGNNKYKFKGVPKDENVYLVAFGSKEDKYYLSKEEIEVKRHKVIQVKYKELSKEDLRKELTFK